MKNTCKLIIQFILITIVSAGLSCAAPGSDMANASGVSNSDYGYDEEMDLPKIGEDTNSGDQYEAVGTNPFVLTSGDPFSTFAADVDTASYDIFKRDINNGVIPAAASVRLEEYINYFEYDYPVPDETFEHPFSISLDSAPGVFNVNTRLLRVGVQAAVKEKPQANLVFLIDKSGSMASEVKLPLVQHLLSSTVSILDPEDTVSIVTYASGTGVALAPTPASNAEQIINVIDSFSASGSTAGGAGINLAYEQAQAAFVEGGINHVILCTDGDFNVGVSSTEQLLALIQEKKETGITLTSLGFGSGNLNDAMMEATSNAGNGTYAVISSIEDADDYVENEMLASILFVAKDVKLQVEFNPALVHAYRLLGYENRAVADDDFTNDIVDGGEIGSGHQVTALYEMVMTGNPVPMPAGAPPVSPGEQSDVVPQVAENDLVLVKVRYKTLDARTEDAATEVRASLTGTAVLSRLDEADEDMQWAAAVAAFAEILKESPFANETSMDKISAIITGNWLDSDREEFTNLYNSALSLR